MVLELVDYYCNGNKSQFANMLDIKPQTVNSWVSRDTFDAELIYTKCKEVSAEWLISGEGSMLKDNGIPEELVYTKPAEGINYKPQTYPTGETEAIRPATSPTEGIPLIPLEAMAGFFTSDRTILEYECERYVVPAFRGADFLIPVKGDSMHPTYKSGDLVACRKVPMSDCFFQWNKVYVVDTNQGPLVKRIKPAGNKESILLVSDNKDYDPIELPTSAIHEVALVMGLIRLE